MTRMQGPPRPAELPVEGPGLSNDVATKITNLACLYEAWGCDKATTADAMVMGAVAVAMEVRGPAAVVVELRALAVSIEASAERIEAAMRGIVN